MDKLKQTSSGRLTSNRHQRDYNPVSWTDYFDEAHDISFNASTTKTKTTTTIGSEQNNQQCISETHDESSNHLQQQDSFRVYLKNFTKPYAPTRQPGQRLNPQQVELSEAEFSQFSQVPTLVALHGGGYSALTWAQFTKHIEQLCECRVLAIDLRSHGDTKTQDDDQMDIDTLVNDVIRVVQATHEICGFPECPKIVLTGHSMGGAIAVKCAARCADSLPSVAGFVIIDVVEGTAKDALPLMMSVIKTRPVRFPTLSNAIEWSVRSGLAKNSDAARVSMPGNLVNIADGRLAIHDVPIDDLEENLNDTGLMKANLKDNLKQHKFSISIDQLIGPGPPAALLPPRLPLPPRVGALGGRTTAPIATPTCAQPVINETDESSNGSGEEKSTTNQAIIKQSNEDDGQYKRPPEVYKSGYGWRTNLAKTQPYWNGWFDGLSADMLAAPVQGKFLLLAGIDRLDKTLTIAQMQGKFMMKVLPKCGHAVHEDVPEQVALAIGDFLVRNKFTKAK